MSSGCDPGDTLRPSHDLVVHNVDHGRDDVLPEIDLEVRDRLDDQQQILVPASGTSRFGIAGPPGASGML